MRISDISPRRLRRVVGSASRATRLNSWILILSLGCGPAQMGADASVFRTVDALFTAVTAHDVKRLDECERRLHGYRDAGKLPEPAAKKLDVVIGTAKSGEWDSAAKSLYDFIQGQRRER